MIVSEEPGAQVGVGLELVPVTDRPEQRLLHEVVGAVAVPGQRPGKGAQQRDPRNDGIGSRGRWFEVMSKWSSPALAR